MQIKSTLRYHLTAVRMAIIKKSPNKTCWRKYGERERSRAVGGNINWCKHYGKHHGDSTKTRVLYDPSVLPLGLYPEETQIQKDTCSPAFTVAVLTKAKTWSNSSAP